MKPRRLRLPSDVERAGNAGSDAVVGLVVHRPLSANRATLAGRLQERGCLRYTPAGIPVIEFRIAHVSEQSEAEVPRRVECELVCVALGTPARLLKDMSPGTGLTVTGFLAARSLKQKTPVLHVTMIEFAEDN